MDAAACLLTWFLANLKLSSSVSGYQQSLFTVHSCSYNNATATLVEHIYLPISIASVLTCSVETLSTNW